MDKSANFGKKRIKAKVGKRAPKKLNATDTAFRTATVDVRPQSVINDSISSKVTDHEEESLELISSRGKTLQQLLPSLNHHASNVRHSALQGIRDALQRKISKTKVNTSHKMMSASIKANLSVLMPSLSRCLVDEDTNVRSCTITILRELIPYLCNFSSSSNKSIGISNNGNDNGNVMIPFLPLAMAYMVSALNSLDDDLRYDGCLAIDLFYTHYGSTILQTNHHTDDKDLHPNTILPAFVRVLTDAGIHRNKSSRSSVSSKNIINNKRKKSNNDGSNNNKNKKNGNIDNRSLGVLKSFISLLQCSAGSENNNFSDCNNDDILFSSFFAGPYSYFEYMQEQRQQQYYGSTLLPSLASPDLTYSPNAPKQNAILLFSNLNSNAAIGKTSIHNKTNTISIQICMDLLNKLRDQFLELTQHHNNNNDKGLSVPIYHLEEFSLLITSFRLLWKQHGSLLLFSNDDNLDDKTNDDCEKLYKIGSILLNHFMECFPLLDDSGNPNNVSKFQNINASICSIISEFGSSLVLYGKQQQRRVGKKSKSHQSIKSNNNEHNDQWVNSIFSYLLPQLEKQEKNIDGVMENNQTSTTEPTPSDKNENNDTLFATTATVTLLKVVGQLLLGQQISSQNNTQNYSNNHNNNDYYYYLLDDESKRLELLDQFSHAFFFQVSVTPAKENDKIYSSTTGRQAAMLLCTLITQQRMEIQRDLQGNSDTNSEYKKVVWQKLLKMATLLPYYLAAWGGTYTLETNVVLGVILSIIRTCHSNLDHGNISIETECMVSLTSKNDDDVLQFVNKIQSSVLLLLFDEKKVKNIVDKDNVLYLTSRKVSIFEQLQDTSQHLLISMIGLLQNPMDSIVSALTRICSRRNVSLTLQDLLPKYQLDRDKKKGGKSAFYHHIFVNDWIVEYIMEVLHSIRFTISKQTYLKFLINSLGMEKIYQHLEEKNKNSTDDTSVSQGLKRKREENENKKPSFKVGKGIEKTELVVNELETSNIPEKATSSADICENNIKISVNFDKALALVCRYLSECGGMEMLKVLNSVIKDWIKRGMNVTSASVTKTFGQNGSLLYSRSAVAILSTFAWNELSRTKSTGEDSPRCIYDFIPEIENSLTVMICNKYLANDCGDLQLSHKFIAPIKVLLTTQQKVFDNVLNQACTGLCSDSGEIVHKEKRNIITNIGKLIKSDSFQKIMQNPYFSKKLVQIAAKLEVALSKTSLDRLVGQFSIDVQRVAGFISTRNTQ